MVCYLCFNGQFICMYACPDSASLVCTKLHTLVKHTSIACTSIHVQFFTIVYSVFAFNRVNHLLLDFGPFLR